MPIHVPNYGVRPYFNSRAGGAGGRGKTYVWLDIAASTERSWTRTSQNPASTGIQVGTHDSCLVWTVVFVQMNPETEGVSTMTTDRDIQETPESAPDAATDGPRAEAQCVDTTAIAGAPKPHDEAAVRAWEGLPPDTMILAPAFAPPPMRCADDAWAMLVTAVDIIGAEDPARAGEVALFAGEWVAEQPPADSVHDGDLVVRLTQLSRDHVTDVEMLLAYQGRWQRVGQWRALDEGWPSLVAPTAVAVMGLHGDAATRVVPLAAPRP